MYKFNSCPSFTISGEIQAHLIALNVTDANRSILFHLLPLSVRRCLVQLKSISGDWINPAVNITMILAYSLINALYNLKTGSEIVPTWAVAAHWSSSLQPIGQSSVGDPMERNSDCGTANRLASYSGVCLALIRLRWLWEPMAWH
jgi:hypothetical protein